MYIHTINSVDTLGIIRTHTVSLNMDQLQPQFILYKNKNKISNRILANTYKKPAGCRFLWHIQQQLNKQDYVDAFWNQLVNQ